MNVQNVSSGGGGKIQTIANAELLGIEALQTTAGTHIDLNTTAGLMASGSGTLRRSHKSSSSASSSSNNASMNLAIPTTPNKKSIATISVASPRSPSGHHSYFQPSKIESTKPQQIHSILKNKNQQQQSNNCHINVINCSESGCVEQSNNPILPPKLYKNNNGKYSVSPGSNSSGGSSSKQIHTITRPNELTTSSSQFTLLSISGGSTTTSSAAATSAQKHSSQQYQQQQNSQYQPTQLRTNIQVR